MPDSVTPAARLTGTLWAYTWERPARSLYHVATAAGIPVAFLHAALSGAAVAVTPVAAFMTGGAQAALSVVGVVSYVAAGWVLANADWLTRWLVAGRWIVALLTIVNVVAAPVKLALGYPFDLFVIVELVAALAFAVAVEYRRGVAADRVSQEASA